MMTKRMHAEILRVSIGTIDNWTAGGSSELSGRRGARFIYPRSSCPCSEPKNKTQVLNGRRYNPGPFFRRREGHLPGR
ncbi:protein of unknown function [Methylacidimicrobium sp. AP8]|nr:protein of unknown function [Methylacidimicrobium sp. AP8]